MTRVRAHPGLALALLLGACAAPLPEPPASNAAGPAVALPGQAAPTPDGPGRERGPFAGLEAPDTLPDGRAALGSASLDGERPVLAPIRTPRAEARRAR